MLAPDEERPGSAGQGGGQHPPGVTRGTVPQRTDRRSPLGEAGKGETAVQETTSAPGDRCGSANPTRSKARQGAFEGGPPELPGRPLEACGNARRRWMAATRAGATARGDRTRRIGWLIRPTRGAGPGWGSAWLGRGPAEARQRPGTTRLVLPEGAQGEARPWRARMVTTRHEHRAPQRLDCESRTSAAGAAALAPTTPSRSPATRLTRSSRVRKTGTKSLESADGGDDARETARTGEACTSWPDAVCWRATASSTAT